YPAMHKDVEQPMEYVEMSALVEDGKAMARLQEEFLGLAVGDVDIAMEAPARKQANISIEVPPWKPRKQQMDEEEDEDEEL
ncbi:hypothetical protein BGZ81_004657, partial [Podila clonocystis]